MLQIMNVKKVKIVATIGPASDSLEVLTQLAEAGVNVFRINLSHAEREQTLSIVKSIRSIEKKLKKPLAIMGDLAGPKIRIGKVENGVVLKNGDLLDIVSKPVVSDGSKVSVNYPTMIGQMKKGAEIFVDDGRIRLTVEKEGKEKATARVIVGGPLVSFKGFYAQGITLNIKIPSKKDIDDIQLMVEAGADALAVSFVQSEKDIQAVRDVLPENAKHMMLIAKIETVKAIENIEKITTHSDGIMVARGDLGLAVPMAEVPHLQKRLITLCLSKSKPVITATQMLESMTTNPLPTRAEVTDVANAILDGTDAVMLSGETAMGKFPVETVKMMAEIIRNAVPNVIRREFDHENAVGNAVSASVGRVADQVDARVVVAFTHQGKAAHRISRHRYPQIIYALSPVPETIRKLNFSFGVFPFLITPTKDFMEMREQAKKIVRDNPIMKLDTGEAFVIAAGMPFGQTGTSNMILVERA